MSNFTTTNHKCPCGICSRPVNRNDKAVRCGICLHWIHYKCNGLSLNDYCLLQSSNEVWYCKHCIATVFPFSSVEDSELYSLLNCRMPSDLEFLPSLDVLSKISGIPYLDNSDIENNIPNPINSKYYYFHDFENMILSSNKSYFSLFHVNLNSLDAHLDDLHATLDLLGFPFQVIGVSETRENVLRGFKMNNTLHGYNLHSQPSRSAAGGVALYASKSLNAVKRTDLSVTDEEFETVWVEIKNNKSKSSLCCCAYRHPSSSPERFTEHIETILHNLARENKNIFILGDFNINLLNCANHPASENFLNMLNSNYLLPYILQPTRVTDSSATLIDNIFANTFNFNALSGNLVTKISDHFPQFLIIEDLKVNYASLNYYKHDYSHFSEEAFVDEVSHLDFSLIYNSNLNLNGKFDFFYDQIDSICKKHVPYKRLSKKEVKISSKPWITKKIFAKMKFRDKLYSKLLKSKQPNPNLHYLYKKFRNRVVKDLKDRKSSYFNQYFSSNKRNMQKLWSGIRSILNVGKCKNSYITSILNNNKPVDNPKCIANIFNNFFANVGKTTEKGIPRGSHSPSFYLRGNYSGSIFLSPVTFHEIWTFIGMMDASKSSGPYSIPVTILKTIRDYISEPLAFLVNDSFASGSFPDKLKLARITPVFKKGSRLDIDNYRPISVLSNFSELFEKAMYHCLYSYLEVQKILYPL